MIKILIIITSFRHGGTSKSLQNLSSIIDNNKHCIDVFAMEHYGPYLTKLPKCNILRHDKWLEALIASFDDTNGITKIRSLFIKVTRNICKYFYFDVANFLFKRTANRLSARNYDVVFAFSEGVPTAFTSHLAIAKKIAWVRCDYSSYSKLNNYPNEIAIYESYNKVVCVSEYTKNEFRRLIPSMAGRVYSIYNALDTSMILSAAKENINDACFTKEQFNIVSIGRIDIVKRFSKIPQIVRALIDAGCSFRWYLIGSGGQSSELTEFINNIEKYCVSNYFFWLGPKDNPYPYIAQSDLLVNTSISEACPNVVNEAKILHTPVVCADFSSASEFIDDGVNGYIIPIDQIANTIEMLIKDKQVFQKLKENISGFVYENELILKQIYSLLK